MTYYTHCVLDCTDDTDVIYGLRGLGLMCVYAKATDSLWRKKGAICHHTSSQLQRVRPTPDKNPPV